MGKRFGFGIVLSLCFMFLSGMTSLAAEADFSYKEISGGIEITDYKGTDAYVVIPEQIDGKTVVSIGGSAFYVDHVAVTVQIPSTVKNIEEQAFAYCDNLQKVTFAGDGLETIGDRAFQSCKALTQFDFPSGLRSIGECAFLYCPLSGKLDFSNCTSVTFARGVFARCPNITEVVLPPNMTKVPDGLFDLCEGLQKVTIPATVTVIEKDAFSYCESLTDVHIPDSVTRIETYAFYSCKKLQTITLSPKVTFIGYNAFGETGLKTVKCQYTSYAYKYFKKLGGVKLKATGAYLKKSAATIYVGEKTTLKMVNASGKTTFKSSKPKVATVSAKGVVKGLKSGKTKITAKNGGITSTCVVTVKPVNLNYKNATVTEGFTLKLSLTGGSGKTKWSSSNNGIATVSSKGKVTAQTPGTATITAKRNGRKYTCKVTVCANERSFPTAGRSGLSSMTYIQLSRLSKSGGDYVGDFLLINNTPYRAVKLASCDIRIYAGGQLFLSKDLRDEKVDVPAYGSGTIRVQFSGGDIHKNKVDLRSTSISMRISNGKMLHSY